MTHAEEPTSGVATPSARHDAAGTAKGPEVVVSHLDMSYDRAPVLRDVSFTVPAGSTTVIMGPSGVGKTTLVRGMLGLREVDHGDITVGGRSIVDAAPKELQSIRNQMGVMLGGSSVHDGSVFASMTAWDNVRYPLQARGHDAESVDARAWQRMIEFGLTDHPHHQPAELSGGLRRRLALARAFVDDPVMIVLDDPGTALDIVNRGEIIESIRVAREHTHATVVLTCHDIDMARALGDQLVVILGGSVSATGPAPELLDGVYETEDFDARFQFKASYAAETGNSLHIVKQDADFSTLLWRMGVSTTVVLGLISLAGIILVVVVTAMTVY